MKEEGEEKLILVEVSGAYRAAYAGFGCNKSE